MESKIRRCMERAEKNENLSRKELERKIRSIDKNRAEVREIITHKGWGVHTSYHLTVNATDWNLNELTSAVGSVCRELVQEDKPMIQLSDHFNYKRLLQFTYPTIVMLIISSVYGVVDGYFVSNFVGKTPFTAINFIMPFLLILGCVGFLFGTGGGHDC